MEYRTIGATDLRASVVGLGCNNFGGRLDAEGTQRVVDRALELGVNLFDTADSYGKNSGSEEQLGASLGARRKDIILATKFGWPLDDSGKRQGGSKRYVFEAVEASLKRLRTDWIDLYQLHTPDPKTPIEETLDALADLVAQGKVRHVGCSNMSAAQIKEAHATANAIGIKGFVSGQHHYNLISRQIEADIIPALNETGMALIPFSPLAAGVLSGKFRRDAPIPPGSRIAGSPKQAEKYLNDASWPLIERLTDFGARRGKSLLEVAIAWIAARKPVCSVIAGAMSPEQVEANVAAARWSMSPGEVADIDAITASAT